MQWIFCLLCLCSIASVSAQSKLSANAAVFEPRQQSESHPEVILDTSRVIFDLSRSLLSAVYISWEYFDNRGRLRQPKYYIDNINKDMDISEIHFEEVSTIVCDRGNWRCLIAAS